MTRDHDVKRAIRARMKATGEPYTVARSALVAPTPSSPESQAAAPQGGTVAPVEARVIEELDGRGFAVLRSFATAEQVAELTEVVDDVISSVRAEKEAEARARHAAGERRIDVWHPGEPGWIAQIVTDRPKVQWLADDPRLVHIIGEAKGSPSRPTRIRALATLPGYGHQGFHPNREGMAPSFGSWAVLDFVVMLSPHRSETGTIRVLPGSHRAPAQFSEWGSAMPPHPDEVRIDAEPGDVLVYSAHLWKSSTFNGGQGPVKSLLVEATDDAGEQR